MVKGPEGVKDFEDDWSLSAKLSVLELDLHLNTPGINMLLERNLLADIIGAEERKE